MSKKFAFYGAVYLYLFNPVNGKILIQQRYQTGYCDGLWSMVAGHLDGNETIYQGLIREVKEEIGIDLKQEDLNLVHAMQRISGDREYFDFYIKASKWEGEPINLEPAKCSGIKWVDPQNLDSAEMIPEVEHAINSVLKQDPFSTYGFQS